MDSNTVNRGRARGRARPPVDQQQGLPGSAPPRPAGAWAAGNPLSGFTSAPPQEQKEREQQGQSRQDAPKQAPAVAVELGACSSACHEDVGHSGKTARGATRKCREREPANTLTTRVSNFGKQGTTGKRVTLQTNYFRLEKRADWCLFQYRVDLSPEIEETATKKRLFYNAVSQMDIKKGLFDGTILYTNLRIHPDPTEIFVDALNKPDEKVRITIRMVAELDKSSYQYLQVFNLIMRKCMGHLNLQLVGRNYYDRENRAMINDYNLELWPGMISSIRQHERDLLMCSEIRNKVMKNITALQVMREVMQDKNSNVSWETLYTQRMLNTVVLTGYNNKTYHIDDVEFGKTPESTFQMKDGSTVTFSEYYRTRYGLKITQMNQPLLVTKVKERQLRGENKNPNAPKHLTMLLIPEFCRMTGLTEQERSNRQMMTALERNMMPTPAKRIADLSKFNERLHSTPASLAEMQEFGLTLSKEIVSLTGRELPVASLFYNAGRGKYEVTETADWTRNVSSNALYRNAKFGKWAIIFSKNHPRFGSAMEGFYRLMQTAAKGMKLNMGNPIICCLKDSPGRGAYNKTAIAQAIEDLFAQHTNIMFLLVVVPGNRTDHYMFVKKKLTVDKGICSQVITAARTDPQAKGSLSVATKVVNQINTKLGGAPWAVQLPESFNDLMVVGYDVCHDPKNKAHSYGAFVSSYDHKQTAYYSTVHAHKNGEELSNYLSMDLVKAVMKFRAHRKNLPRIILYRDGVGDGQFTYVYEHEMKNIKEALGKIYAEEKVTFRMRVIIVNKRGNARLFKNANNPLPGTVVDDVITMPERSDFYLISQCSRKGTVSPTYYNILGPDHFGLDSNGTQLLTHRLCHNYYNWSGTVRVPAPCQYAHKLAYLAANTLQRPPHPKLDNLLHFL